ncbi:MAG: ATP-binding protein [Anaerolineales bacterium]
MPENVQEQAQQLKNAIETLESQREVLGDAVVEASLSALRKQLAELEPDTDEAGRHKKLVSLVFVDVVNSTKIGQHLEPEEILEIMDSGLQRLALPIEQFGGRVTRFMGDGFKAVFGDPITQENDAEMAVRASLAILEDAQAYAVELQEKWQIPDFDIRVGVNTGIVAVGGFTESDDTMMGLPVNLGARLESAAPPGGILISHETHKHVRGIFDIEPLPPVIAKGFEEPVRVYLVKSSKPRAFRTKTRGLEGVTTRMIGREAELKRVQDVYFSAAEDGECQVITVIGEAGVGKSRLLDEFETWLGGQPGEVYLLKGRSSPETQEAPYSLLRDTFSQRFQIQASDRAREVQQKIEAGISDAFMDGADGIMKAHFIGQLLGFDFGNSQYLQGVLDDAMQLRDRAWRYLGEFIQEISKTTPVLVFLDDIHWADDSSLDLINYLAQSLSEQRFMVVCLARAILLERRPLWGEGQISHTRLNLNSLSSRDGRHLVEEILHKMGQVPIALRELVVSEADGNPFYIEELIKMLIDTEVIVIDSEDWHVDPSRLSEILADMDVPSTLTSLLQARLDRLVPEEKRVIQQAAVIGRVFWDDAIQYLYISQDGSGDRGIDLPTILEQLRIKEMIYHRETSVLSGTQEFYFKHAILREVAYDTIFKKERQAYHSLAAEWLINENTDRAVGLTGMIAEHLESAGEKERAVSYFRLAGEQAAGQYANQSALNYLGRALALAPESDLEERFAILLVREQVYSLLGTRDDQKRDLDQLVQIAAALKDESKQSQLNLLLASSAAETSNYSQIISYAEQVIQSSKSLQLTSLESKANILWGRALLSMGDYLNARGHFSQALQIAQMGESPNLEADSLRYLGAVDERLGKQTTAIEYFEKALNLYRQIGDRRGEGKTLNLLGNILLLQGDLAGGKSYYDQFLNISREIGDRWGEGQVIRNIADAYLSKYDYGDASKYLEQALEITREIGNRTIESSALVGLGNIYLEQAEFAKAKSVFEQSLSIARDIGNKPWEAKTLSQIGRYFHRQGDYLRAQSYYDQAIEIYHQLGNQLSESRVLTDLSLLHHHLGDDDSALEKSKIAASIAEQLNHPRYQGRALTQQGRAFAGLDRNDQAAESYLKAGEIFNEIGQPNLSMEALAGLSDSLLAGGKSSTALTHVDTILNHLQENQMQEVKVLNGDGITRATSETGAIPGLEGTGDPMWVYLTCYRVLLANKDTRAQEVLSTAQNLLQDQAGKIKDPDLKYSFLNNVIANREIQSAGISGGKA